MSDGCDWKNCEADGTQIICQHGEPFAKFCVKHFVRLDELLRKVSELVEMGVHPRMAWQRVKAETRDD